jgi:DNA processing protein
VVLITEAAEKSGSLHTARFALEQGKTVMAVPGPITSPTSQGTNNLIKQGATPVTSLEDVLFALHLAPSQPKLLIQGDTPEEAAIIALLQAQIHDGDTLLEQSRLSTPVYQHTMTMLELKGVIRALGANQWSL